MSQIAETIRTTCPRDCYDSCGITAIFDDSGELRQLVGDADHELAQGRLCPKCALAYNGAWRDEQVRLRQPLKRVGAKGKGQFEPVSWDEALTDIAGRLTGICEGSSSSRIFHTHYTGTCSVLGGLFPLRFFNRLGATEVEPDTVCNNAAHASLNYTFGESCEGFDPDTIKDSKSILVWGANPSYSAPHVETNWLSNTDATVIVIDPIAHPSAKAADMHLQLRPGSDAALAFGFLHIALRDGHIDAPFVSQNVVGWDEVLPSIEQSTPELTAEMTGLAIGDIEAAAAHYCSGPSLIWLGQGLQRQRNGGNIYRSCALLCVGTGNLARPGSGILFLNGPNTRGADVDYVVGEELGENPKPDPVSHMDLAEVLESGKIADALICWNNNIVASNPEQARLKRALENEELFHVCVELFETDTTAYADYILPAASFMEYDDILFPYFQNTVSAISAVKPAPGDALPNAEVFRRLARAMGFEEEALYEDDRAIIDHVLGESDADISFDELKRVGTKKVYDTPRLQFADLKFATPSGRIEIASETAERDGCSRIPYPHADELPADGRLRVLSPSSEWTLNSSYANDKTIRKRMGPQSIQVNASDASRLNLVDGQAVTLENEVGKLRLQLKVSEAVQQGVAIVPKGNWLKFEDASGGNINLLNAGEKTDMGESSCVHNIEAHLTAAD